MTKEYKTIEFDWDDGLDKVLLKPDGFTLSSTYYGGSHDNDIGTQYSYVGLNTNNAVHMGKEILDYYDVGRNANLCELRNEHAAMESLLVERLDNILAEALRSVDMSFGDHITRQQVLNTIGQLTTVRRELIVFLLTEDPKQETNMNQYINTEA